LIAPKPLVWLRGEIKTPPFSHAARMEATRHCGGCKEAIESVLARHPGGLMKTDEDRETKET
jgi:hypothetical protein